MRHHCTQGKGLIAGQSFGGDGIQSGIVFSIAKEVNRKKRSVAGLRNG